MLSFELMAADAKQYTNLRKEDIIGMYILSKTHIPYLTRILYAGEKIEVLTGTGVCAGSRFLY
jgi:hypothetical protein